MSLSYTYFDLLAQLLVVPEASIVSRTIYSDGQVKAVVFGFAAGQELSEHTAAVPAIIHILKGEARLTLGGDVVEVREGTWLHMPAQLQHSVSARTPLTMLLLLLTDPHGS